MDPCMRNMATNPLCLTTQTPAEANIPRQNEDCIVRWPPRQNRFMVTSTALHDRGIRILHNVSKRAAYRAPRTTTFRFGFPKELLLSLFTCGT